MRVHVVTAQCAAALCAAAVCTAAVPGTALAQRGAEHVRQEASREPPTGGFPGFFDAYVADKGHVVGELPLLGVDYGVTENLTVGTNAFLLLANLGGYPGGWLKVRYRVHARPRFAVAVTGYGGGLDLGSTETSDPAADKEATSSSLFCLLGTVNASLYPDRRTSFTLTLVGAYLSLGEVERVRGTDVSSTQGVYALGAAFSFERFFNRRLGVQATVLTLPVGYGTLHSDVADATAFGGIGLRNGTLVRLLLEARLSRWLLSAGPMWSLTEATPAPIVELSRRF